MISFRFHVVSITAVFLAIAIGVVVGTTYVDGAIVDGLRNRIDNVERNLDLRRAENDRLESDLGRAAGYIDASGRYAVTDRLTGVPVLVVAVRGIDEGAVENAALLSRQAGAVTPGVVWLEAPWGLEGERDRTALAEIVGAPTDASPDELWTASWEAIVTELGAAAGDGGSSPVGPDAGIPAAPVLSSLEVGGFLSVDSLDDDSSGLADMAGTSPRVLVMTGTRARAELAPMVPFAVDATIAAGMGVVLADVHVEEPEGPGRGEALLESLRDGVLDAIALVDHADQAAGRVAAVLAVDAVGDGLAGHFGYGPGAEAALPPWTAP